MKAAKQINDPQCGEVMFIANAAAAAKIWLAKLAGIGSDVVDAILAEVPPQRMSPITRQFTSSLLSINQRRLLL